MRLINGVVCLATSVSGNSSSVCVAVVRMVAVRVIVINRRGGLICVVGSIEIRSKA